jgi:hypothetical protein
MDHFPLRRNDLQRLGDVYAEFNRPGVIVFKSRLQVDAVDTDVRIALDQEITLATRANV